MNGLTRIYKRLRFGGSSHRCNVCGMGVRRFLPFSVDLERAAKNSGFPRDFKRMETLNYDQCNCPFCMASDRERLYALYLDQYFQSKPAAVFRVLDFAPSPAFSDFMRGRARYTTADLFRDDVDLKVDVCDMPDLKDGSCDIVICSHVLEHVREPDRAIRELRRILTAEGFAIIMVPIFEDVPETIEDPGYKSEALRLRHYGQGDHVRLFAKKDFVARLKAGGFSVKEVGSTSFDKELLRAHAIAVNSILYICRK